jgi:hypothetical protein
MAWCGATQDGGSGITITDLTLKFYGANGSLSVRSPGARPLLFTVPGNGGAGFAFVVSQDELARVNSFLATSSRLSLEASFTGAGSAPKASYPERQPRQPPSKVPEPGT